MQNDGGINDSGKRMAANLRHIEIFLYAVI